MREVTLTTNTVTTTTSNNLYLIIAHGPSGPVLTVSRTPVPGGIEITRADYRAFCFHMLHVFYKISAKSTSGKDVWIHDTHSIISYFLYARIARLVAPGLNEPDQLERTALALYSSNVTIPPDYYQKLQISRKSFVSTRGFEPVRLLHTAWNTSGRSFFDMSVVQRVMASESLQKLLNHTLNAIEDLNEIRKIIKDTRPEELPILLSAQGTATIIHLKDFGTTPIQRTGTALQMALYGGDEDIVALLKDVMDEAEFEHQSKEVFKQALSPEKQNELDKSNATALDYYNAMLVAQTEDAKKLCHDTFLYRVVDGKEQFTINDETIANFKTNLESYVRNNSIHNPAILQYLYEIYEKLPGIYAEDCLFSEKGLGLAHGFQSARFLHHLAQGIYYLAANNETPRRSFICRDSNPDLGIRSLIPNRLGVDSFMSGLGAVAGVRWGVWPWRLSRVSKLMSNKNSKLSELMQPKQLHQPPRHRKCEVM